MKHCPSSHEPVVTKEFCIYCKVAMVTEFDRSVRAGHDFETCGLCKRIPDSYNQGCSTQATRSIERTGT